MEPQTDEELARSIQSVRVTRRRIVRALSILLLLTGSCVALFIYSVSHDEYASWMMLVLIFCLLALMGFGLVVRHLNDTLDWLEEQQALGQMTHSGEGVWPPAPERPKRHE